MTVSQKTQGHGKWQYAKAVVLYDECINYGRSAKECEHAVHTHSLITEVSFKV